MTAMTKGMAVALLLALFCGGSQAAPKGYRAVPDSELPRHAPTGITFPATAGALRRQWVHEKLDDPRSVRVGYGVAAYLDVTPSGSSASTKLKSMKRSLLLRHPNTAVTQLAPGERELFHGWNTVFLKHSAPLTGPKRDPGDRPRRDFLAARRCGQYMLSARAWSVDPGNTEQLRRLGQAMREIFAEPCRQDT